MKKIVSLLLIVLAQQVFAATGDSEPAEQYYCPVGAICGVFPR